RVAAWIAALTHVVGDLDGACPEAAAIINRLDAHAVAAFETGRIEFAALVEQARIPVQPDFDAAGSVVGIPVAGQQQAATARVELVDGAADQLHALFAAGVAAVAA